MTKQKTVVVFRVGECGVFALLPFDKATTTGLCGAYGWEGHSAADYARCIAHSRPAKPEQWAPLLEEMRRIGYTDLAVRKRKPRVAKPKPARGLAEIALEQFEQTGELTGLGALADKLEEEGRRPEAVEAIRLVLAGEVKADAVRFFTGESGHTDPHAKLVGAVGLAQAEEWLERMDGIVEWIPDGDYDPSDYDYPPDVDFAWGCEVEVEIDGKEYSRSLWDIYRAGDHRMHDLNHYARYVAAELASELKDVIEGEKL